MPTILGAYFCFFAMFANALYDKSYNRRGLIYQLYKILWPAFFSVDRLGLKLCFIFLCKLLNVGFLLLKPYSLKKILDKFEDLPFSYLAYWISLFVICWLFIPFFKRLKGLFLYPIINQVIKETKLNFLLLVHNPSFYPLVSKYDHQEILQTVSRLGLTFRTILSIVFVNLFPTLLKIGGLIGMLYYHWNYTFLFLFLLLVSSFFAPFILKSFLFWRKEARKFSDKALHVAASSLGQSSFSQFHFQQLKKGLDRVLTGEARRWEKENSALHGYYFLHSFLNLSLLIPIFLLLVRQLYLKEITVANFVMIKSYVLLLSKQFSHLLHYLRSIMVRLIDIQKLLNVFTYESQLERTSSPSLSITQQKKMIHKALNWYRLDQVNFSYGNATEKYLLTAITCHIKKGSHVLIQGESGSGKSTLAKMLVGLLSPKKGQLNFCGHPLSFFTQEAREQFLFYIGQQEIVSDLTFFKGIKKMPDTIFPLSLQKKLKEKKITSWSAGEKQRLLLARCFSFQPQIVLLDEAFSFLDKLTARKIICFFQQQISSVILITHSNSFGDLFDQHYLLKKGRLIKKK